jgi:deoxyxylulose-5-phosphate synthase
MSAAGMIPFFNTFSVFATRRAYDQIFMCAAYPKLNVKIVGGDAGVSATSNGGTHMPFEDMGILRVMPGVTVMEPSDGVMLADLIQQMADTYGVQYIRFTRKNAVRIYEEGSHFEIGKLIYVGRIFENNILSRNSDICRASLDVNNYVRRLHPEISDPLFDIFKYKLSAFFMYRRTFISCLFKNGVCLFS